MTQYLVTSHFVIIVTLCNICDTLCKILSHFVIPVTLYYNFLLHFIIINYKSGKISLFVSHFVIFLSRKDPKSVCEAFFSHFVRKTVFTKNLDNIQIFDQIWSKKQQNCLLNMKLCTYINLNMLNLIVTFVCVPWNHFSNYVYLKDI